MEDTLRDPENQLYILLALTVLILVLMEDTLRGRKVFGYHFSKNVLILVLMEDTLREVGSWQDVKDVLQS